MCPFLAAVSAFIYGHSLTPTYIAKSELAIQLSERQIARQRNVTDPDERLSDRSLALSWTDIPRRAPFLQQVSAQLRGAYSAAALRRKIRSSNVAATNRIALEVSDSDADRAGRISREVTANLRRWIRQWPKRPGVARVTVAPKRPDGRSEPKIATSTSIAAGLGLAIGAIIFILTQPFSPTARTLEQS